MMIVNCLQIASSQSVVWNVTEDVEKWPEWSPTFESIERLDQGPFGLKSEALIKQPGMPPAVWRVTEYERGKSFSWEAKVRGIHFIGIHEIETDGDTTISTLKLNVSGVMGVLLWPLMKGLLRDALAKENKGLKTYCESISQALT